jgi:hypothetical protein
MSKYIQVKTEIKDEKLFATALQAVCQANKLIFEHSPAGLVAYGFSSTTADYVIRKRQLRSYGDLAFRVTPDGVEVIIDDLDTRGREIVNQIKQGYSRAKIEQVARARGLDVQEVPAEGGAIRLRLVPKPVARGRHVQVRRGR